MSVKLFISPNFRGEDKGDGGIRRVVEAQKLYLPNHDIEIVSSPDDANVLSCHAGSYIDTDKPTVSHCHGLYWSEYNWPKWAYGLNEEVTKAILKADVVTAPSEWVSYALKRALWVNPIVLNHGINPEEWHPETSQKEYVLWNKTRVDPVCDPSPLDELAKLASTIKFISTFGQRAHNVEITGTIPYEQSKDLIRKASVYLSTTRETFGISTLEAMACGVPILGWNWGGQAEFIIHKKHGWLCTPGDFKGLLEGLQYIFDNRNELSGNCRQCVIDNFTWPKVIVPYADLYKSLLVLPNPTPTISVIIRCYNLSKYLPESVNSVLSQSFKDFEVVIVDDCSTDDSLHVAQQLESKDTRVKVIQTPHNLYISGAMNFGIIHSKGKYILSLDADDLLEPSALSTLSTALDKNNDLDIAYGSMKVLETNGRLWISDWPPTTFNFVTQMAHKNQIPTTCMFRRKVWERSGGHRIRCMTAEDADFWCRVTSIGFHPAKVTEAPIFTHRVRDDSVSHKEPDWDWTSWYPWSRDKSLTPLGVSYRTPSFEPTLVSVIIPVGPRHGKYVVDAVDSIIAQTFIKWECIVVDDTGNPSTLDKLPPFVKILSTGDKSRGPAVARNMGIATAKGRVFLLLDADDYLHPTAIQSMYSTWLGVGGYVYTDWRVQESGEIHQTPNYDCNDIKKQLPHAITIMVDSRCRDKVSFDETMEAWEDWDFVLSLARVGYCGTRVPEPLLYYRVRSGARRDELYVKRDALKEEMRNKWQGVELMACSGCRKQRAVARLAAVPPVQQEAILIEYTKTGGGTVTYTGQKTNTPYRFGPDSSHRVKYVHKDDLAFFLSLRHFKVVMPKEELVAAGSSTR